jgi:hypothetical protein
MDSDIKIIPCEKESSKYGHLFHMSLEEKSKCEICNPRGKKENPVNHPSHYNQGTIECIEALKSALTPEQFTGFCRGNAIKYLWRAGRKGSVGQDLLKAKWYIEAELATLQQ